MLIFSADNKENSNLEISTTYIYSTIGKYNEDKYLQLLNLVGLHEQRWPEDLLTRSAMALVLLGILRASGYFGIAKTSTSADTYTNNELFIGSLLLRHLQVLLLNMPEHIYNSHYGNGVPAMFTS